MVFNQLYIQGVMLEGMILKPNMVLPGLTCPKQESVDEVADATVRCLLRAVPAAVPGIAFLSGGQTSELASARLNAMAIRFKSRLPWAMIFPAGPASRPTRRSWLCMPRHARKPGSSRSSSRKCSWTARIPWRGAAR